MSLVEVRVRLEVDPGAREARVGEVREEGPAVCDEELPLARVVVEDRGDRELDRARPEGKADRVARPDAVPVAEELARDHALARLEGAPHRLRRGAVEEVDPP